MLQLIIGVKGTGKTKHLIQLVNDKAEASQGNVVCIEKGEKLRYDIKYQVRLINSEDYMVTNAGALYGFLAGILASNHDVTDVFVDSTLKICALDTAAFEAIVPMLSELAEKQNVNLVLTVSTAAEELSADTLKYAL
jgi:hypothetical protein